jgi:3-oxoacyl-[acyl-carrier-protein] synthase-3
VERLDNERLAAELGIAPAEILERTGIRERRVAGTRDSVVSLATEAARAALEASRRDASDVDLVLLSTYTPDRLLCPSAPEVAHRIGAGRAGAFDVNAACAGGLTALLTAAGLLSSGLTRCILVVAADVTTRFVRRSDAKTRLVFGDGAAALLLDRGGAAESGGWSVLSASWGADGSGAGLFGVPARVGPNGADEPVGPLAVEMNGSAIYRFAVDRGADLIAQLLASAGLSPHDVTRVVPHQANARIIAHLSRRTGIPHEKWFQNLETLGNTASASAPLAIVDLLATRRVHSGDVLLLVAFGAGLTWCGMAVRVG